MNQQKWQTLVRNDFTFNFAFQCSRWSHANEIEIEEKGIEREPNVNRVMYRTTTTAATKNERKSINYVIYGMHVTLTATTNWKMLSVCPWQWRFSGETDRVRFTGSNGSIAVVAVIRAIELTAMREQKKTAGITCYVIQVYKVI